MVTFVCYNCDATLKKKQLDNHVYQCRPAKFVCIDCQKIFDGNTYKAHTQCMTEQEKYHGPYANKNKNKQNQQNLQQQQQQQKQAEAEKNAKAAAAAAAAAAAEEQKEEKSQKKQDKADKKKVTQEEAEEEVEEQTQSNWKGWKKTIRKVIKQKANKQIKLKKLKQLVCQQYKECYPEEEIMDIEKVFDEKLASNSKFQVVNEPYVKL